MTASPSPGPVPPGHRLPARFLLFLMLICGCASIPAARAEQFRTLQGQTIEGDLSAVYGDLIFLATRKGSYRILVQQLDDDSLRHVAAFLARPAEAPPKWSEATTRLGRGLVKKLRLLRDGKLVPYEAGDRREPEFYLVYFGAYWCGPCRRFSPHLVEAYHRWKKSAPDRFEVVFVSDDQDGAGQLAYAREVNMPFPVLRFGTSVAEFDRWRGDGIPCLVVLNRRGDVLFHSYNGTEYLGAMDPLEKFTALHTLLSADQETPTPARHRLALARHRHTAGTGDRRAEPYLINIDLRRNRTLPKGTITARLTIDAQGRVQEVAFSPQLETVAALQLQRTAEDWLFLPDIRQGKATPCQLDLPLQISE